MSRDVRERSVVFVEDLWEFVGDKNVKSAVRVEEMGDNPLGKLYEAGYQRALDDLMENIEELSVLLGDLDLEREYEEIQDV